MKKILDRAEQYGKLAVLNKIDIIKKVLMLDTKKEIDSVLKFVADAISRECDQDELDKKTFEQWKKARDDE